MPDVLKNYGPLITATVGICTTLFVLWVNKRRARKALVYEVAGNSPLVSKSSMVASNVQVLFNGHEVQGLRLIDLKFRNSGGQPIEPGDFHEPVRIELPPGTVYNAGKTESFPQGLTVKVEAVDNGLVVSPLLLNPGDWFIVRVMANLPPTGDPRVFGRVKGVTDIVRYVPPAQKGMKFEDVFAMVFVVFTGFYTSFGLLANVRWAGPWTPYAVVHVAVRVLTSFSIGIVTGMMLYANGIKRLFMRS